MKLPSLRSLKWWDGPGSFVLMYHRIAESSSDPWRLCVSPSHFAEQLDVLHQIAHVVSLDQLVRDVENRRDLRDVVALTFDDGYADNLVVAKPLLERNDMPATVFITTGYVDCGREFWWDELDRVLLQAGDLPTTIHLSIDGATVCVELREAAHYSDEAACQHRGWRAFYDEPPGRRQMAYLLLWEKLVSLPAAKQSAVLDALLEQSGVERTPRSSHRTMSREEIAILASSELIEIGAHTVTHPSLPTLPLSSQRTEIAESRSDLEDMVQRPVLGFSYPHGRYTPDSVRLVREAGFRYACAVQPDHRSPNLVKGSPDRYLLPRIAVLDWDGETFQRLLMHGFRN